MANVQEVQLPDIGDFDNVPVIEVLVKPGDEVNKEDSLVTLESDKATMEVPSPYKGVVKEVKVKVGDELNQGDSILDLEVAEEAPPRADQAQGGGQAEESAAGQDQYAPAADKPLPEADVRAEVVVLGAGPGGYTTAFRAADLGKQVVLVERYPDLGGVCLNVGCIPSKALLHVAEVIDQAEQVGKWGVKFQGPEIDTTKLLKWKQGVVNTLTSGLSRMAKQRGVKVIQGTGAFQSANSLTVAGEEGTTTVAFEQCVVAAGSRPIQLPDMPHDDPRVLDSTKALELPRIDGELLVVGGGIIGLEMATMYHALGCKVTVVELGDGLIPGVDRDLIQPLEKIIKRRYGQIYVNTKVTRVETDADGLTAYFDGPKAPESQRFDQILVAVGRRPNSDRLNLEAAGLKVDERGFIPVDSQQRTNVPHIFAIGDIIGQPLLAHKASHEGKVAAEVIAGEAAAFDNVVPSVAYTDPEVAWVGILEEEAQARGLDYETASFPWGANGRSLSMGRNEGITKLVVDKSSGRLLGVGITGPKAGELIAEATLAIEMRADAEDLALTIHPHPTLSETMMMSAEIFSGTITDLYMPKKQKVS